VEEAAAKFVQTIAWKPSLVDETRAVGDRFQAGEPDPGPGFLGLKLLKDRDRDNSYLGISALRLAGSPTSPPPCATPAATRPACSPSSASQHHEPTSP
jgi:hypothetical protein